MKATFSPGLSSSCRWSAEAVVKVTRLSAKAKVVRNLCLDFMKVSFGSKLVGAARRAIANGNE
jgi:hypothetical protein